MNEFANAFLSPFSWSRIAFERVLNDSTDQKVDINSNLLTKSITDQLSSYPGTIENSGDWNNFSLNIGKDLAGIYASINYGESYSTTLRQKLLSRIEEGEKKLRSLEGSVRAIRSILPNTATTAISISGGDTSWIDQNPKYYKNSPPLNFVSEENCYRLPDTGAFSSIRSNGGIGGTAVLEKTLTPIEQIGNVSLITDGSRETYWLATSYLPALVKTEPTNIPWLSSDYVHGYAGMLTYYMDRPVLAGEIYIDPISTEPFTLLSISWTPLNIANCLTDPTFSTLSAWNKLFKGIIDTANSQAILMGTSGLVYQSFNVASALAKSLTGIIENPNITTGQRCELIYSGRSLGDVATQARIIWYDTNGTELSSKTDSNVLPNFFNQYRLIDYAPIRATSGRVEFYINSNTTAVTSYIQSANLFFGEQKWTCSKKIESPITIPLPAAVTSSRFSFTLLQTSPRRESFNSRAPSNITSVVPPDNIDGSLKQMVDKISEDLKFVGPGSTVFAYKIGIRELDLRYREYVPRATLTSIPLLTDKEIRDIWISVDSDNLYDTGVGFHVIPFDKDDTFKIPLRPYKLGADDTSGRNVYSNGSILSIFTREEEEAGWATNNPLRIITDPQPVKQVFDGTDRNGRIKLSRVTHIRRPSIRRINSWYETNGIWPTYFDPNAGTLIGINSGLLIESIRTGNPVVLSQDNIKTSVGYLPVKVTVSTSRWTAPQDIFGKPDTVTLRSSVNEVLEKAAVTETTVEIDSEYVSYEQYLSSTKLSDFLSRNPTTIGGLLIRGSTIEQTALTNKSIKEFLDIVQSNNIGSYISNSNITNNTITFRDSSSSNKLNDSQSAAQQLFNNSLSSNQTDGTQIFQTAGTATALANNVSKLAQAEYERYRANRILPKTRDITTTKTSVVDGVYTFKTKYTPIVKGDGGSLFKLYWVNSEGKRVLVSSNDYSLNSNSGLVVMKKAPPDAAYTSVQADYKYINKTNENSQFADTLSLITDPTAGEDVLVGSKTFPVCRNMTDYVTGRVPNLRRPNFDTLDKEYYPIIEYFITPDGEVVFSRDFFSYGDLPATITVEYETLGVTPRLEIDVVRSSGVTTTPKIFGINLRTREGTATPIREAL